MARRVDSHNRERILRALLFQQPRKSVAHVSEPNQCDSQKSSLPIESDSLFAVRALRHAWIMSSEASYFVRRLNAGGSASPAKAQAER